MGLKVGQLAENLARRNESATTAALEYFSVNDDATVLSVRDQNFPMDEIAASALAGYLKIPPPFYHRLTPEFRATVLRYEFDRNKDADTVIEVMGEEIVAVHQPSALMLPLTRVSEVVSRVFKPEDTVRRLSTSEKLFHVDVTTADHALVLDQPDTQVGDVTEAGVRFLAYPFRSRPPSVSVYAERLVCMNGQTTPEKLGLISIKGRTVDEVIAEMEEAAGLLLGQLDEHLDSLAATRTMTVPGSPQAFAAQLAREAKVSRTVLDAVLDIINQLDEPVSVWDVNQAFTTVANRAPYSTMVRLQNVGGQLAFAAEQAVQRCAQCERLL